MKFILIYITNPTKIEARKIAKYLLKKKLIACANIYKSDSFYFWERKLVDTTEYVLIGKTVEANFSAVQKEVKRLHPHKIPCIIKIPAEPDEQFFSWVKGELK